MVTSGLVAILVWVAALAVGAGARVLDAPTVVIGLAVTGIFLSAWLADYFLLGIAA
jgi:hypothetical protein